MATTTGTARYTKGLCTAATSTAPPTSAPPASAASEAAGAPNTGGRTPHTRIAGATIAMRCLADPASCQAWTPSPARTASARNSSKMNQYGLCR